LAITAKASAAKVYDFPHIRMKKIVLLEVIPFEFLQHLRIAKNQSLDYHLVNTA